MSTNQLGRPLLIIRAAR